MPEWVMIFKFTFTFWMSHDFEAHFHFSKQVMILKFVFNFPLRFSKLLFLLQFCRFEMQGRVVTYIIDFANVFKLAFPSLPLQVTALCTVLHNAMISSFIS